MSNIAIITARGGSKRIPKKNIKNFCGKPILLYSIEAALNSGCFDEVMVSTDDKEIAEIAKMAGASVPFFRSEKTSDDFATTMDVIVEVIAEYEKQQRYFENACVLYPTAPFVTSEKLRDAMDLLEKEKVDSVIPIVKFSFPPQRAFVCNNGRVKYAEEEHATKRSQDLEPMYHDCGQFCCFHIQTVLASRVMVSDNTRGIVYSELEVHDIDSYEDWQMAELKYTMMKEKSNVNCNKK